MVEGSGRAEVMGKRTRNDEDGAEELRHGFPKGYEDGTEG